MFCLNKALQKRALQITLVRHRARLEAQCVLQGFQEREPKGSVPQMGPHTWCLSHDYYSCLSSDPLSVEQLA